MVEVFTLKPDGVRPGIADCRQNGVIGFNNISIV